MNGTQGNGNPHTPAGQKDKPYGLTDREWEMILTHRQLQAQRKYCKLTIEYINGEMRYGVWQPVVKWE